MVFRLSLFSLIKKSLINPEQISFLSIKNQFLWLMIWNQHL